MAEFIDTGNHEAQRAGDDMLADAMAAFGKPVPFYRRTAAVAHARDMGMKDARKITGMIQRACEAIERDQPHAAIEAITACLDLTGAYRLLSVLCTAPDPSAAARARRSPDMIYEEWGF